MNISAVTLGGAQMNNYAIAAVPANEAIGFITPATLTLSVTGNPTKGYDGTTSTGPFSSGVVSEGGGLLNKGGLISLTNVAFTNNTAGGDSPFGVDRAWIFSSSAKPALSSAMSRKIAA